MSKIYLPKVPYSIKNLFKLNPKILILYEFILDHTYIDFKASQILKKEIFKTIIHSYNQNKHINSL